MKHGLHLGLMMLLTFWLAACGGKQSAVEGKLVDWNGKPVAGAKITASQVQPLKGYEQFETLTKADGTFRLGGLFPSSEYVLHPWSDKWICKTEIRLNCAPQGETSVLPAPMVIEAAVSKSSGLFLADLVTGAPMQSAVEGKLVDWNGKPVAGAKITASQVQPLKGYEQFETLTKADGTFRLGGFFPSSEYVLRPWSDKWTCNTKIRINCAPQGETSVLPAPMVIEAAVSKSSGLLLADLATGAPMQSAIEGKLVDWGGKPAAGVKIIATQDQPLKGYEQFEAVTNADGTFRLSGLFPSSAYVLRPLSDKWTCKTAIQITCAPHGKTSALSSPMVIDAAYSKSNGLSIGNLATGAVRFTRSSEGIISDAMTKLEWCVGLDKDIYYEDAVKWVKSKSAFNGGGWRMPTRKELLQLYQKGIGTRDIDPAFELNGYKVWAKERDSSSACLFYFSLGYEGYPSSSTDSINFRVFAVRSGR